MDLIALATELERKGWKCTFHFGAPTFSEPFALVAQYFYPSSALGMPYYVQFGVSGDPTITTIGVETVQANLQVTRTLLTDTEFEALALIRAYHERWKNAPQEIPA